MNFISTILVSSLPTLCGRRHHVCISEYMYTVPLSVDNERPLHVHIEPQQHGDL